MPKVQAHVRKALKDAGEATAKRFLAAHKADDNDDDYALDALAGIAGIDTLLSDVAADSGQGFLVQLKLPGQSDLFDQVNDRAVAYAKARAAELVSGVDDATRDDLKVIISNGLEENVGMDEIAGRIRDAYAFSDDRAELIARTEITMANQNGALEGMKAAKGASVKLKKVWVPDDEACFPVGATVMTPQGEIPIEQICQGDLVLTSEGQKAVKGTSKRQFAGRMVVVKTSKGRVLSMTDNHPVFANNGWINAGDVEAGDTLQTFEKEFVKVGTVIHVDLVNAQSSPIVLGEIAVAARVTTFVKMPDFTIDFDCNTVFFQGEINAIPAQCEFLRILDSKRFQSNANGFLNRRFAPSRSIASEAAKFTGGLASAVTKGATTALASAKNNGLIASLGTILGNLFSAFPSRLELFSAALARNSGCNELNRRISASATAILPRLGRKEVGEGLAAVSACAANAGSLSEAIALCGTKVPDRSTPLLPGKLYSALAAIIGEGHSKELHFCNDYEHKHSSIVHNLSVADAPEYFANGLLVHNCDDCQEAGDSGPIGLDEDFPGVETDAPPGHPRCECSLASESYEESGENEGESEDEE